MLRENKVLIYERIFSLTETCKTQSNHQAHEIIIPQLSQRHTVAHRILRGEKKQKFYGEQWDFYISWLWFVVSFMLPVTCQK